MILTVYRVTLAKIGAIELDCSISESHTSEVEVTEHPVEVGSAVSDHARRKPLGLTIEGMITDTPVDDDLRIENKAEGFQRGKVHRAKDAYQDLCALRDAGEAVTIVTALHTYKNMVLTSLAIPRNSDTGEALRFTAQFKEIRTVESGTVEVTTTKPKTTTGKSRKKIGKKPSKPVDPRTGLAKISDGASEAASDTFALIRGVTGAQ